MKKLNDEIRCKSSQALASESISHILPLIQEQMVAVRVEQDMAQKRLVDDKRKEPH